jgi:hypothetical protein
LRMPTVGRVSSCTNRIIAEIRDREDAATAARLVFEESNRRLTVRFEELGWLAGLEERPGRSFRTALAGLYAMSDVDSATDVDGKAAIDLRIDPLTWSDWVAAWEKEVTGPENPPVVSAAYVPLPGPPVSETSLGG